MDYRKKIANHENVDSAIVWDTLDMQPLECNKREFIDINEENGWDEKDDSKDVMLVKTSH